MSATLGIEVPGEVLESARMTIPDAKLELAIALFAGQRLSLGKAAELAGIPVGHFQMHLGVRNIGPHYDEKDALDDRAVNEGCWQMQKWPWSNCIAKLNSGSLPS